MNVRRAWTKRGELDASRDNLSIIQEILKLREEQAQMHGYANFATYATADTMAGSPSAVMNLLEVTTTTSATSKNILYFSQRVWDKAKVSIERERELLQEFIRGHEASSGLAAVDKIEAWDWRYYAEKVK
jgi:peptidyl-dipeptidase Dcp